MGVAQTRSAFHPRERFARPSANFIARHRRRAMEKSAVLLRSWPTLAVIHTLGRPVAQPHEASMRPEREIVSICQAALDRAGERSALNYGAIQAVARVDAAPSC
jgi:hypothetical protein